MRKRLKRAACIWLIASMVALVGCNETKNDKADETTKQVVETKENDSTKDTTQDTTQDKSDEYPYGTFDFEEACKHIEINGKKVDFPFTLNDLGDDYEFVDCDEYVEGIYSGYIAYKGEKLFTMSSHETSELTRNSKINDISIYSLSANEDIMSICGIKRGTPIEDVIEIFGETAEITDGSYMKDYMFKSKNGSIAFMCFTEKNVVAEFQIIDYQNN